MSNVRKSLIWVLVLVGVLFSGMTPTFANDPVNIANRTNIPVKVEVIYFSIFCPHDDYLQIPAYSNRTAGSHRGGCLVDEIKIQEAQNMPIGQPYYPLAATAYVHFEVVWEDGALVVQHAS